MEQAYRFAWQTVVLGEYVGCQCFEACIADVHQLLIVWAVHVGLVGAHLQHTFHHRDHTPQACIVAVEPTGEGERIAGFADTHALNSQRLCTGGDTNFDVSACLPP